ncbi:MAG: AMP-binding protein [Gammaproteobacteria bacterium]|jgi:long-chain acyl-CoA synthetase
MDKIWLQSYPKYIPATIDIPDDINLVDLFTQACEQYKDANAYSSFSATISYQQLYQRSEIIAAYFQQKLNLTQGDRIAIMIPNLLQFPLVFFAALRAGLVVVPVNPMYTPRELLLQLKDAQVSAIVVLEQMAFKLASVIKEAPIQHIIITQFQDFLTGAEKVFFKFYFRWIKKTPAYDLNPVIYLTDILAENLTLKPVTVKSQDLALLQYTGGTTGLPRGVMLTHYNIAANVMQTKAWVKDYLSTAKEKYVLAPLPMYHIFSLMANNILLLHLGFENILIVDPRRINTLINILRKRPLVLMTGVNTLYYALLQHPKFKNLNFSEQKVSLAGGMALQEATAVAWQKITGKTLIEAYGLSESSPAAIINPLDITEYNGAMGLPIPNTDIKICDDKGIEVALNEVGELWLKGPQVTQGYWNNKEETQHNIENGWLKTGDLVKIDAKGYVHFVDRKKNMLVISGFNVYPTEIEDVICTHPMVANAAVIGLPDPVHGQKIKCFVIKKDPQLTEQMLRDYLREQLTGYKRPEIIEFCDALPLNAVGKVLHRKLR